MSIVKGINVGYADVGALYSGSQDVKGVNVNAVNIAIIGKVESIPPCVYNGEPQTPNVILMVNFGEEWITLIENTDYTVSYTNNINVTNSAEVTVAGKGNYTGRLTEKFVISNADIIVDTSSLNINNVYNGGNQAKAITENNITISGNQTYTIKYGISNDEYTLDSCPEIINVSDSKYIYFKITADNHNPVVGSYSVEITPKEAQLVWGNITSWVYDGDEHLATCEVLNLIGDDICNVNLIYNSITDIGDTIAIADSLSNENYKLPLNGLTQTITVLPGLFIKKSGVWTPIKKVYKKINGSWVEQSMLTAFDTTKLYMKKD